MPRLPKPGRVTRAAGTSRPAPARRPVTGRQAIASGIRGWRHWNGRATRAELLWWTAVAAPAWLASMNLAASAPVLAADHAPALIATTAGLVAVAVLPMLIPLWIWIASLAVLARRIHDTGRGTWWTVTAAASPAVTLAALAAAMTATGTTPDGTQLSDTALLAGSLILAAASLWHLVLAVIALLPSTPHPTRWDTGHHPRPRNQTRPRR